MIYDEFCTYLQNIDCGLDMFVFEEDYHAVANRNNGCDYTCKQEPVTQFIDIVFHMTENFIWIGSSLSCRSRVKVELVTQSRYSDEKELEESQENPCTNVWEVAEKVHHEEDVDEWSENRKVNACLCRYKIA